MTTLAQEMFGQGDGRWFYTGLEFGGGDIPSTYYPGNRPFHMGIHQSVGDGRYGHPERGPGGATYRG
ncbi:hypothetical protein ACFQFG_26500 [Methylobacterium persicinum]|jgi:hypothetical protein|uniref:Uncharacterized protein n=1 Tax=Methylobacterium persicinum TaxID=374426 RepID=A0ABU0HE64_9HYPH|nr:hypothetical protein EBB05_13975 [Methylobacterium brachiatum]MDQ0440611.1 hypothetical protein [Methylobacterium persicinum]GJE36510.1 hypothetical protein KHHGKMAE_0561 [Methylobacterium persicinum]